MPKCNFFSVFAYLSFSALLLTGLPISSATASPARSVLRQSPQAIEQQFGRYWTRLTGPFGQDKSVVLYTYAPGKLRQIFPKFPKYAFSITFVHNKAERIELDLGSLPNVGLGVIPSDEAYGRKITTQFFQHIFNREPNWKLLQRTNPGESVQIANYCVGDGIRTDLISGQLYLLNFSYDARCLPQNKP